MARKPRVIVNSVAGHYAGVEERIIEVSFADGSGALISLTQPRKLHDGTIRPSIEVYRTDDKVAVLAPRKEVERQHALDAKGGE